MLLEDFGCRISGDLASSPHRAGSTEIRHPTSEIRFSGRISLSRGGDSEQNTQSDQNQFAHANPSTGDVHEMRANPQPDTHDDEPYQVNPERHTQPSSFERAIR